MATVNLAGVKWPSAHLQGSQNFFLVWPGQASRPQIARITLSEDGSPLAAATHKAMLGSGCSC